MAINEASITVSTSRLVTFDEMFSIDIVPDDVLEENEMFNITLGNTQDRVDFTESTTTITILNDDSKQLND